MNAIVTKDWINTYIATASPEKVEIMVGRALVGLLGRQTGEEQAANTTNTENGIGFTGADAYSGGLTAKSFIKNGGLQPWQVAKWTKLNDKGSARLAKYHRQLNEIAHEMAWLKKARQATVSPTMTSRQALSKYRAQND